LLGAPGWGQCERWTSGGISNVSDKKKGKRLKGKTTNTLQS